MSDFTWTGVTLHGVATGRAERGATRGAAAAAHPRAAGEHRAAARHLERRLGAHHPRGAPPGHQRWKATWKDVRLPGKM